MQVLIVSATSLEIAPLLEFLKKDKTINQKLTQHFHGNHKIHVLVPGVGMTATAYWMGKTLAENSYELAINLGLAGSFDRSLRLAQPVNITSDQFSEMGAENGGQFLSMLDLDLLQDDDFIMANGLVTNATQPDSDMIASLPQVKGITVNTVHGNDDSIKKALKQFHPQVETMEGAAFLYSCLAAKVTCAQIRTLSNYVEKRNKENWELQKAIESLNQTAIQILEELA